MSGDQPVVSDYDGDGRADVGIFRPGSGEWWIQRSTAGLVAMKFGTGSDRPVQGDYTGDGKADVAVWRPSTGEWYIIRSEDLSFYAFPFGTSGDVPAPGDYDGDGKSDATVFRPSSATWYIARGTGGTQIFQFGANGDRPSKRLRALTYQTKTKEAGIVTCPLLFAIRLRTQSSGLQ